MNVEAKGNLDRIQAKYSDVVDEPTFVDNVEDLYTWIGNVRPDVLEECMDAAIQQVMELGHPEWGTDWGKFLDEVYASDLIDDACDSVQADLDDDGHYDYTYGRNVLGGLSRKQDL